MADVTKSIDKMSPGQKAVPRGDFTLDGGMVVAM